jgi:cephalosporin-C deacetylase
MSTLKHSYSFDPTYNYTLEDLQAIMPPIEPADFTEFWQHRYAHALQIHPRPRISHTGTSHQNFEIYDLSYQSTEDFTIGGWLLISKPAPIRRGIVVGHGYGGREAPDLDLPVTEAAFLFPCFRGLSRSRRPPISDRPEYHVLHDLDKRDRYILGGCVADLWLAVSALLTLFPWLAGHIGYMGISFGGGIGALALPWDSRIQRAHLNVPTFGHQPLRLTLPTTGSAHAVQGFQQQHGHILATLAYYDAAIAAKYIRIPVHVAAARFDPVVAPPCQFAIYNALSGPKSLFVLEAGHFHYPNNAAREQDLRAELSAFFAKL